MAIEFQCPACQAKMRIPEEKAGKRGACPACKAHFEIPAATQLGRVSTPAEGSPVVETAEEPVKAEVQSAPAKVPEPVDAASTSPSAGATPSPSVVVDAVPLSPKEAAKLIKTSAASAAPAAPAPVDFIKFNCPNCGKMTGFPSTMAATPAGCPICHAQIMIPKASGEETFVIGALPPAPPAVATGSKIHGLHKAVAHKPHRRPDQARAESNSNGRMVAGIAGGALAMAVLVFAVIAVLGEHGKEPGAKNEKPGPARTSSGYGGAPAVPPPQSRESERGPEAVNRPSENPAVTGSSGAEDAKANLVIQPKHPPEPAASPAVPPPADDLAALKIKDRALEKEEEDPAATRIKPEPQAPKPDSGNPLAVPKSPADNPLEPKPADLAPPIVAPAPPIQPAKPEAPAPPKLCGECMGTHFLPNLPHKPYVWLGSDAPPLAQNAIPWRYCFKCQQGQDAKVLFQTEVERLAAAPGKHQAWEQQLGVQLVLAETQHVTLHAQLPQSSVKRIAGCLDQLTGHLQTLTRSTVLTPTRPDTHEILVLWNDASYNKLMDAMAQKNPGTDVELLRKTKGCVGRAGSYFNAKEGAPPEPEHMAVFQFGQLLMLEATDGKCPAWLKEGFAAYAENIILQKNLVYSFRYEMNEVKFGINWNEDLKKLAQQSKLKPWDQIFPLDLIGMKSLDYLTCYSMVSFLIKNDPRRFCLIVLRIRDGLDSTHALEEVYAPKKIRELQQMWAQWALAQR